MTLTTRRLSTRQRAMLRFIRKHIETRGYAPTLREIGDGCQISAVSVVLSNLRMLEKKGHVVRQSKTSRAIGLVESPPRTPKARRPLTKAQTTFITATRKAHDAKVAYFKTHDADAGTVLQDALLFLVDASVVLADEMGGDRPKDAHI